MGGSVLDTRNPTSKLMLTILAAVASWEREIMLERQREGIAKAKAEGRYKGRKPTAQRHAPAIIAARATGKSPTEIAREFQINRATVYRLIGDSRAGSGSTKPFQGSN
jgi:DNA invertase Pin-like site-specific DNA recombinase